MKKRYTTLLILCILLAVVAGAVVLLRSGQAEDADSSSEVATILETEADRITSLELDGPATLPLPCSAPKPTIPPPATAGIIRPTRLCPWTAAWGKTCPTCWPD